MDKKIILIGFLIIFSGIFFYGVDQSYVLAELVKPNSMVIDSNNIYISDQASVLIYNLKDFKFSNTRRKYAYYCI